MCNLTLLEVFLATAGASITAAILIIGVAAALNASFFGAPGSPGLMITAGILTGAAVAAVTIALSLVNSYFECMGSPSACEGVLSNLTNILKALIIVLSIQAVACFVAAGIAWIPWAGIAPMFAIAATLIIQLGLIPSAVVFSVDLINCAENAVKVPAEIPTLFTAGFLTVIVLVVAIYFRRKTKV